MTVERKEMRPEMRADKRDAAARARELLDHGVLDRDVQDKFHLDTKIVPSEWEYEWKRLSVYGKEDPTYEIELSQGGWEPVPADRHPELMPKNNKAESIEREGMILMERPKQISDMVRAKLADLAQERVEGQRKKLAETVPGQLERRVLTVKKTVERVAVPE